MNFTVKLVDVYPDGTTCNVQDSNFLRFVRNLNTGGNNYNETEFVVARNTIHHLVEYPSRLVLPIVK